MSFKSLSVKEKKTTSAPETNAEQKRSRTIRTKTNIKFVSNVEKKVK